MQNTFSTLLKQVNQVALVCNFSLWVNDMYFNRQAKKKAIQVIATEREQRIICQEQKAPNGNYTTHEE